MAEAALTVGGLEEVVVAKNSGVGEGLGVLGLDLWEDLLVELVFGKLGLGQHVAEELDEEVLITTEELGGEKEVLLGEGGGEDASVELGFANDAEGGTLLVGLEEVVLEHVGNTGVRLVARTGLDSDGDGGGQCTIVGGGGGDAGCVCGGKGALGDVLVGSGAESASNGRGGSGERHVDADHVGRRRGCQEEVDERGRG